MQKRAPQPDALYLAWAASAFAVLLLIGLYDERYLFFVVAPLAVITFSQIERFARGGWKRAAATLGLASVFAAVNLAAPPPTLRGPAEAAALVVNGRPERVLYCGRTNGAFTFAVRARERKLDTVVLRGDKLPPGVFAPQAFEDFAHRFGIDYIVLERSVMRRPWNPLFDSPTTSMKLIREIPQPATDALADGRLRVYRFTRPAAHPEDMLKLPVHRIGGDVEVEF